MLFFSWEIIRNPAALARRGLGAHPQRSAFCPKASAGRGNRPLDDFLREMHHSGELWMISLRKSSKARGNVAFLLGNHLETGCPRPPRPWGTPTAKRPLPESFGRLSPPKRRPSPTTTAPGAVGWASPRRDLSSSPFPSLSHFPSFSPFPFLSPFYQHQYQYQFGSPACPSWRLAAEGCGIWLCPVLASVGDVEVLNF